MAVHALVDANNFYATCEKVFDPAIARRPVVVLSNNDGCIVARSAEAKALGIAMGAPIHEWRDFCQAHGVIIRSSNYVLYGDMSARMLAVLQDLCPEVESYSIDESFLDLTGHRAATALAHEIRDRIHARTRLSCGVGVGATRTLAKLANLVAKKRTDSGVFNLLDLSAADTDELMASFPVGSVWGVGWQLRRRLEDEGIKTVLDLRRCNSVAIRRRYGSVLEKTVHELNGTACLSLEEPGQARRQLMSSRSFARVISDTETLQAAITHHASRVAEKLRAQHGKAQYIHVMLRTNPNREQDIQYRRSTLIPLSSPSADTRVLLAAALAGLREILRPGLNYHKCAVMLSGITTAEAVQPDLLSPPDDPRRIRLMGLMDRINLTQGRDTLRFATADLSQAWHMRAEHRSPRYTTCWQELPVAHCI